MIDLNLIRNQPDLVKKTLINRQKDPSLLSDLIVADTGYLKALSEYEKLKSQQNALSKTFKGKPTGENLLKATEIKNQIKIAEENLKSLEKQRDSLLEEIPNIPADDVPVGKDDSNNVVIKTVGSIPKFEFKPLDHIELGEKLDILDVKKAGDLSGSRFGYFKNEGAILEMALMHYAFKKLVDKGFHAMIPPAMIKSRTEWMCGYASNKNLMGAYYSVPEDDLIFISSSEHSVVPYHADEILPSDIFPIKYVNYSPCFRRESGTYGKDTRGLFRVHFFNKVEMNVFTLPDYEISDKMCLEMRAVEEEILNDLGLSYQIVNCCTGDLPQPNRRMYDLNCYFPGQDRYRETHSCSNCGDYQARRLNTRVKINGQNQLVHILNATVITDRAVLAIIENFQTKEGGVNIPECLWLYTGFHQIHPKL